VELYTELFYVIIPTLFLCLLLICYPYISLHFFILVHMSLFFAADAWLCWSLPSITEQQVCPHRLPMQYWLKGHSPDQALFKPSTPSTSTVFLIQQSCIIITFHC